MPNGWGTHDNPALVVRLAYAARSSSSSPSTPASRPRPQPGAGDPYGLPLGLEDEPTWSSSLLRSTNSSTGCQACGPSTLRAVPRLRPGSRMVFAMNTMWQGEGEPGADLRACSLPARIQRHARPLEATLGRHAVPSRRIGSALFMRFHRAGRRRGLQVRPGPPADASTRPDTTCTRDGRRPRRLAGWVRERAAWAGGAIARMATIRRSVTAARQLACTRPSRNREIGAGSTGRRTIAAWPCAYPRDVRRRRPRPGGHQRPSWWRPR